MMFLKKREDYQEEGPLLSLKSFILKFNTGLSASHKRTPFYMYNFKEFSPI